MIWAENFQFWNYGVVLQTALVMSSVGYLLFLAILLPFPSGPSVVHAGDLPLLVGVVPASGPAEQWWHLGIDLHDCDNNIKHLDIMISTKLRKIPFVYVTRMSV